MAEIFSPEIVYSTAVANHGSYLYRKIQSQNNNAPITLSNASSSSPVQFQVSPMVWNPSKSYLNFDLQCTVPAGAPLFLQLEGNLLSMISRITVYSSLTSAILLDLTNVEKYTALTLPASTNLTDFMTKTGTTKACPTGPAPAQLQPTEAIARCDDTSVNNVFKNNLQGFVSYTARVGSYNNAANNRDLCISASINLKSFVHTILALNKDIYHTENLIVDIYFNGTNNFVTRSTGAADPITGAAVTDTAVTISNYCMQLATESNLRISSQVIDSVLKGGISLPFCYPTCIRQSTQGGVAQSYSISLTSAYGKRLLGIISAPFLTGIATLNVHQRGNLITYNSFMNSIPIRYQQGFNCLLSEDWMLGNQEYCTQSAIQDLMQYTNGEWFHADMFTRPLPLWALDQTVIDGYDLSTTQSVYSIQATLSGAQDFVWVSVLLGQKTVTFSPQGIIVN
jgi:hypothetical protein